jgi:hypothetical protein
MNVLKEEHLKSFIAFGATQQIAEMSVVHIFVRRAAS